MANGFEKDLGDGLVLRSVRDERDIQRYAAFQFDMFHNTECLTVDRLLHYHPEVTFDDFLFVDDTTCGRIASTTCFVPWHCRYDEVELRVAQLEVVATHPDYRRRGLVRQQIRHFHDLANERGYEMTAIGGIPYYYRQFGYTYAVDQGRSWLVPAFAIPAAEGGERYRLRPAGPDDAEALHRLYEAGMQSVQFHDKRPLDFWRYLMQWAQWPATLVERADSGEAVGYFSAIPVSETGVAPTADESAIYVSECGIADAEVALAALRLLAAKGAHEVIVGCPATGALSRLAAGIGAAVPHWYQWLLRLAGLDRFLRTIGPVLERRLAGSEFSGFSGVLRFNNFVEAADVLLADGRIAEVRGQGFVPHSNDDQGGDFVLPPDAFLRLALGYRTLAQLRDPWPDIVVKPGLQPLLETLFPPMTSYLTLPYSYRGPVPERMDLSPGPSPARRGVGGEVISASLRALGLAPGDTVMMHCSLTSVGNVHGGAGALIDAVLDAVGPGGTVMMPALPDVRVPFDGSRSPSTVGLVSEVFRQRHDAVRSRHPSHSVAAIGPRARELTEGHERVLPTGYDSPYERLCRAKGWVLLLGVDHDRNTTLHLAETLAGVPYLRTGNLQMLGDDGTVVDYPVEQMAYGHREFIGIDKALRQSGMQRQGQVGEAVARLLPADAMVAFVVDLLRRDPAALLCRKPRCVFCLWARAQVTASQTGMPDTTDWAAVTRRWGCGDPSCECCVV